MATPMLQAFGCSHPICYFCEVASIPTNAQTPQAAMALRALSVFA